MAAAILPSPSKQIGPCVGPCEHVDCKQTREMAESACVKCGEPIGYETPFFQAEQGKPMPLIHARCLEEEEL